MNSIEGALAGGSLGAALGEIVWQNGSPNSYAHRRMRAAKKLGESTLWARPTTQWALLGGLAGRSGASFLPPPNPSGTP